jgi:hypothetical protein
LTIAVSFLSLPFLAAAQSVDYGGYRPHYQGYGVDTTGGRGGTVCRVTSVTDLPWPAQPGTLRHCVENVVGARIVIFEVSGTIRLVHGELTVRSPYITIAGQTAPSPGILLRSFGIAVDTHDVVIQHLRIRIGNVPGEPLALSLRNNAHKVVIDHVSLSWSVWTAIGIGGSGEMTITDSIIAESLACSGVNRFEPCDPNNYPDSGSSNSRAILIGDDWSGTPKVTMIRNVSANNNDRHPAIQGRTDTILVNNMIYNPSLTPQAAIYYLGVGPARSVAIGNILVPGATTPFNNGYIPPEYAEEGGVTLIRVDYTTHPDSRIYLEGNYAEAQCGDGACLASPAAQWALAKDYLWNWARISVRASTPPLELANLPLSSALPYSAVEAFLLANVGARPGDRDAVDNRLMNEIVTRTGSVPNRTADKAGPGVGADGFPILPENRRPLTVPLDPHAVVDQAGRTRIEWWLEEFARELEAASGSGPVVPMAPRPPQALRIAN